MVNKQSRPSNDNMPSDFSTVDYKTCDACGFRLMRVEPFIYDGKLISVENCPICGLRRDESGEHLGKSLSPPERNQAFDAWLAQNGLNRDILEKRYFLSIEVFFSY